MADVARTMRTVKSYVLRQGRSSKPQEAAFAQYGNRYLLSLESAENGSDLFGNDNPVVLEIGFGMGESLASMAKASPHVNFLGVEVHRPGVGALMNQCAQDAISNLRIYHGDALDLIGVLPDNSLDKVQIFFPDPWPKTRHRKRRLIQAELLTSLSRVLKTGGLIHCATDWEPYAEHMMEVFNAHPLYENTSDGFVPRPEERPLTKYEARGHRLSHQVNDLVFQCVKR